MVNSVVFVGFHDCSFLFIILFSVDFVVFVLYCFGLRVGCLCLLTCWL